jgi:hypothetical protein
MVVRRLHRPHVGHGWTRPMATVVVATLSVVQLASLTTTRAFVPAVTPSRPSYSTFAREWTTPASVHHYARSSRSLLYSSSSPSASALPEVDTMRAGEIKKELESYGISTKSFLEKSELVEALKDARSQGLQPKKTVSDSTQSTSSTQTTQTSSSSSTSEPRSKSSSTESASSTSTDSTTSTTTSSSSSSGKPRNERLQEEMQKCAQMRNSELKKELQELGISTSSFFEKSEFVKALAEARVDGVVKKSSSSRDSTNQRGGNGESYAEYKNVEVVTDDSGPRKKGSAETTPDPQAANPFAGFGGGGGASPFGDMGGMGGIADMLKNLGGMGGGGATPGASPFGNMGGMGGIADMLKNMGGMGGGASPGANPFGGAAGGSPFGGGGGGMGDMFGKAQQMMQSPKVREIVAKAQSNPRIMSKVQECMSNPASFVKYQNDPDVRELIDELRKLM